ncbi:sulfite exporter TauE/SafE family protein [bacterium]|nr:MAG: sulfite exporter TauE/SafE family protein [bacterium]
MSPGEILTVVLTVLFGATLQGSVGFGMGLIASPILILIDPRFVPGPILLSTTVLTVLLVYRERTAIDFHGIQWAMVGRLVGTVLASAILLVVSADQLVLLIGVFILSAVGMSLSGFRFDPIRPVLVVAGMLSGLLGTIASVGGPPMALVYQHAAGARIRSTMSGFFLLGTILSLGALWYVGRFGAYEIQLTLVMLPSVLTGFVLSKWTAVYVDRGYVRPAVLSVAAGAGLLVIIRQFV